MSYNSRRPRQSMHAANDSRTVTVLAHRVLAHALNISKPCPTCGAPADKPKHASLCRSLRKALCRASLFESHPDLYATAVRNAPANLPQHVRTVDSTDDTVTMEMRDRNGHKHLREVHKAAFLRMVHVWSTEAAVYVATKREG